MYSYSISGMLLTYNDQIQQYISIMRWLLWTQCWSQAGVAHTIDADQFCELLLSLKIEVKKKTNRKRHIKKWANLILSSFVRLCAVLIIGKDEFSRYKVFYCRFFSCDISTWTQRQHRFYVSAATLALPNTHCSLLWSPLTTVMSSSAIFDGPEHFTNPRIKASVSPAVHSYLPG